ncbi:hypothetical protein [Citrobacter freundii]|uniref:hypothetical protein n=1 Tax=Citrobacter freundii TaxID=546 RepID=UPI0016465B26|nr:hypothetical protein [Citrobacter freundii]
MTEQAYDFTKIKEIDQTDDAQKVNYLLANGWVLLKVTETQSHDEYGALHSTVWFTVGNPQ